MYLETKKIPIHVIFFNKYVELILPLLGAMPEDHEIYYGFTKFAMELNEIDKEQVHKYAPTDTRFRPDQR